MENILKSRTVITIIVLFLVNGVSGIRELIPAGILPIVDAVLSILAIYFRIAPKSELGGMKKVAK